MNEFAAKKLGEVLAFCRVGVETLEMGREGFEKVFAPDRLQEITDTLNDHAQSIKSIATAANMQDVTLTKADGTGNKLRSMRDMYVGDEWDNAAELLEWSGFFEGAAIVHWALVEGAGKALQNEELEELGDDGKDFHEEMLEMVEEAIEKLGGEKAVA